MSFTERASGWRPFYFILFMVFFFGMMFGARNQSTSSSTARAADAAGGTAGPTSSALAPGSIALLIYQQAGLLARRGCWPRQG